MGPSRREWWLRLAAGRRWPGYRVCGPHVARDYEEASSSLGRERPEGGGTQASTSRPPRAASGG